MLNDVAVAFLAAVLALVGWGIRGAIVRSRRVRTIKAALAVEIATVSELVKANKYSAELRAHALEIRNKGHRFGYEIFLVHIGQSYFSVFEANTSELGELDTHMVVDIVAFYQSAKSLIDACSSEAQPDTTITPAHKAAQRYDDLADAMDRLCAFGDNLAARLATSQVADQIALATKRLRPEITSLIVED